MCSRNDDDAALQQSGSACKNNAITKGFHAINIALPVDSSANQVYGESGLKKNI